jgi:hypothetical protein
MTRPRQEPTTQPPHSAAPCRVEAPAVGAPAPDEMFDQLAA